MKLYPLIYTNEAARTVSEALDKDVFAYKNGYQIALISANRLLKAIDKAQKQNSKAFSTLKGLSNSEAFDAVQNISMRALVAAVYFRKTNEDLYRVKSSTGVANFGPLAYQLVMWSIQPAWLMSDDSLTPASQRVWQKMYELSEQGVYERKFLGEFNKDFLKPRFFGDKEKFNRYIGFIENGLPPNEDMFLKWSKVSFSEVPTKYFGSLWAYRKTSHDSKIQDLFDKGKAFIEKLKVERNIPYEVTNEILANACVAFFDRLYGSAASD